MMRSASRTASPIMVLDPTARRGSAPINGEMGPIIAIPQQGFPSSYPIYEGEEGNGRASSLARSKLSMSDEEFIPRGDVNRLCRADIGLWGDAIISCFEYSLGRWNGGGRLTEDCDEGMVVFFTDAPPKIRPLNDIGAGNAPSGATSNVEVRRGRYSEVRCRPYTLCCSSAMCTISSSRDMSIMYKPVVTLCVTTTFYATTTVTKAACYFDSCGRFVHLCNMRRAFCFRNDIKCRQKQWEALSNWNVRPILLRKHTKWRVEIRL